MLPANTPSKPGATPSFLAARIRSQVQAGQDDLKSETLEGALFIEKAAERAAAQKQTGDAGRLTKLAAQLRESTPAEANENFPLWRNSKRS